MPTFQRRGPAYRHQAQHTRWADPEYRAQVHTDRWLVPLCAVLGVAVTLAFVAISPADTKASPGADAQPASVAVSGAGEGPAQ